MCIEIEFTSRMVDLVAEGFDLALRGTDALRDSSLISRRIAMTPLWMVASPAYLKRRGTPKNPDDLAGHDCVLFRPQAGVSRWKLSGPRGEQTVEVRGAFGVDDMGFARELACRGSGIALIPSPTIADDLARGRLSRVLPEHRGPLGALHLVYPSAQFVPQAVRLLRDYLYAEIRKAFVKSQTSGDRA